MEAFTGNAQKKVVHDVKKPNNNNKNNNEIKEKRGQIIHLKHHKALGGNISMIYYSGF